MQFSIESIPRFVLMGLLCTTRKYTSVNEKKKKIKHIVVELMHYLYRLESKIKQLYYILLTVNGCFCFLLLIIILYSNQRIE